MKRLLSALAMMLCCLAATGQYGLTISELLYQPLSGEAEYVELYNRGDAAVELSGFHIVRWVGDSLGKHYALPTHTVGPHDYVVLTKDAASVAANYNVRYMAKVVECQLPTYPNDGGSVILSTADSVVVDRFDYHSAMHSRLLRDKAGVSLERRSFERATNDAGNWFSASSTSGYGTPGYENSQSMEALVEERAFAFSSDVVSPDGDGYQDELEVTYEVEDGSLMAKIEIYDARGFRVRLLLNNALLGTHGTLVWDGHADNGAVLPRGQYIVQTTVYDTTGTRQVLRKVVALML